MGDAETAWGELSGPWRAALEEAWVSWTSGSVGIGAVAVDAGGEIVGRGRNRIFETAADPGVLAGTMVAHAEMNALAAVTLGETAGLTVYTSLEPCLMCAASMVMLRVGSVFYAAPDPCSTVSTTPSGAIPSAPVGCPCARARSPVRWGGSPGSCPTR